MLSSQSLHRKAALVALSLLGLIGRSISTGSMTIASKCDFDIWYQICTRDCCVTDADGTITCPQWQKLSAGTSFSYPYSDYPQIDGTDDGIVLKFGRGGASIMQLETCWSPDVGHIEYDVSELNDLGASPFLDEGYVVWPTPDSTVGFDTCNTLHCGAGENPCTDAYWLGKS